MRIIAVCCLLLPSLLSAVQAPPVAKSTPGQPTEAEVTALGLLNLYRMKTREAEYIIDGILQEHEQRKVYLFPRDMGSQWVVARKKPEGLISPVVINPALMTVARTLLSQKVKWVNKQPVPFAEPFRTAGYTPDTKGLILIGSECTSLRVAFVQSLVNIVGEGMANKGTKTETLIRVFAGRESLQAPWREAGVAVEESGGKCSLVIVLGTGAAMRYVGGITYADANHNGVCDPGEAKAGVKITAGDLSATSGPAGAWWIPLTKTDEMDIVFTVDGLTGTRKIPLAAASEIIDWRVPNAADMKNADKLLADNDKAAKDKDEEKRRKALAAVLAGTRMAILDDDHQHKVDAFIQPIREDYDELLRKALSTMGEDEATYKKRMNEYKLPWKGCFTAWFKEIDSLYQLRQQVSDLSLAKSDKRTAAIPGLTATLAKAIATSTDPVLQEQFQTVKLNLDNLPPPPAETAKPPKK